MSEIRDILRQLLQSDNYSAALVGTVEAVDKTANSCQVQPIDGSLVLDDVRLNPVIDESIKPIAITYPLKGSYVIVAFIDDDDRQGYVALCGQPEEISFEIDGFKYLLNENGLVFNGGDNGGLINIGQFLSKLNANMNAIIAASKAAYTAQTAIDASAGINAFNLAIKAYS